MALEKIQKANDIKELTEEELKELSDEIRQFLIEKISVTGGHLASNLGVVELTMALHKVLHFPEDKLIWDVGHQSYTHKLLTGRKEGFDDLRKYGGMSGFPKRKESKCDAFDTGHSSTSIFFVSLANCFFTLITDFFRWNVPIFLLFGIISGSSGSFLCSGFAGSGSLLKNTFSFFF